MKMRTKTALPLILCLLLASLSRFIPRAAAGSTVTQGVWNNCDFSRPPIDWVSAAKRYVDGTNGSVVDLVLAQADITGYTRVPFPLQGMSSLISYSDEDEAEPYLKTFDNEGVGVILSLQPLEADVPQLMELMLTRYGQHSCIVGINVDLEWKHSGAWNHVSNNERDAWLAVLKGHNAGLRLFLTYYGNRTYFPGDAPGLVVLFDGEGDAQVNLLERYGELAAHFSQVGIYTGYTSSSPPTASNDRILASVPKTRYIIHTDDLFPHRSTIIFEMDNICAGWLESTTINLIDLHIQKNIPLLCGVMPRNIDDPVEGSGYLPNLLRNLDTNYPDLFEIGQQGFSDSTTEGLKGKTLQEQREIIEKGFNTLNSIGISPATFVPLYGSVDNTSVRVIEDLGFKRLVNLYENLSATNLFIMDSWISLTENSSTTANKTVLKSPDKIMAEIDNKTGQDPIIILYQTDDFRNNTQYRVQQLSNILDRLKSADKYQFMTPRDSQKAIEAQAQAEADPALMPALSQKSMWQTWTVYALMGALAVTSLALLTRRLVHHEPQITE
jgi:hypothetical protein